MTTARTNRFAVLPLSLLLVLGLGLGGRAWADPALRVQMDLHGDFALFGNTVAQDCARLNPAIPAPVVGTIGTCSDGNNLAPDAYWRSDDPGTGQALADTGIAASDARSTAMLVLPQGASVIYARLYWGALSGASGPDQSVRVQRPSNGLDTQISADDSARVDDGNTGHFWYQSTADVTSLVKAQGPGAYRIADIESINLVGLQDTGAVIAWFMVVFYQQDGQPSRNLAIFDGLDLVDRNIGSASASLSGFLVPNAGFDAKLGVMAYEGESELNGDSLSFNGSQLSDAQNPATNFFNASRTYLGNPVSNVGDLPQLTGGPRSLSNVDLDVVDVTSLRGHQRDDRRHHHQGHLLARRVHHLDFDLQARLHDLGQDGDRHQRRRAAARRRARIPDGDHQYRQRHRRRHRAHRSAAGAGELRARYARGRQRRERGRQDRRQQRRPG
jgi:hypothetical protein